MRRFTFPFWGRGTVLCTVDEAIYLVPVLPPIKAKTAVKLSVISYEL